MLLLDRNGRVSFANTAALRLITCEPGMRLEQLAPGLGGEAVDWLAQSLNLGGSSDAAPGPTPDARLPDGRVVRMALQPIEQRQWALRLQLPQAAPLRSQPSEQPVDLAMGENSAAHEMVRMFWASPFPVTVQDTDYRLIEVNRAYLEFTGYRSEQLIGIDPMQLQPDEDRAERLARRAALRSGTFTNEPRLVERRLVDASGHERWYRAARREMRDESGKQMFLAVFQDCTAEHAAREQADRSVRELDQWFDLAPIGMVLFDEDGLFVRTNPAFEALVGVVPALVSEAHGSIRQLLGWRDGGGPSELLQPGSTPIECHARVTQNGRVLSLRATVRCHETRVGQRRFMAVVNDQSIEEERDLAQLQIGALMDTAGVGLATFREASGWVRGGVSYGAATDAVDAVVEHRPHADPVAARTFGSRSKFGIDGGHEVASKAGANAASNAAAHGHVNAALQAINRDMVLPESLPEYERVQHALRHAERVEARYAIQHPEMGLRWLLTRVEPGLLASGARTASVVTLDVTEQQTAQARNEQLLRELTTILDSTTAGIGYVRGDLLLRCNRRFERLLGLTPGSAVGKNLQTLFDGHAEAERIAEESKKALSEGWIYETEFSVPIGDRAPVWRSLSVRRTGPLSQGLEAIAVLSDITRLKTQQVELEILARDRELMFSLSEVGIASLRDGRVQRANGALSSMAGYAEEEMAGLDLDSLFPRELSTDARRLEELEALRRAGRWTGERRMRRKDGSLLWVQTGERLVHPGEPRGGIIASYVNVDARHRAEQALSVQAERTRAVLDSVLVGIVTVGRDGIEWMNRSARRMFGGDMSDFVGRPISMVATADAEHPFRQSQHIDGLVEGQARTFECRVRASNGREFWVAGNLVATGGHFTYALLDIEQRRQAEVRIAEAQASLQRIIEMAPLGITLRDARNLRVLQINQRAAASAGRPVTRMIGTTPEEVYDADMAWDLRRDLLAALDSSEATQREYRMQVDGETRVLDARYLPLASRGAAADQVLLVTTDVTEQRAAQEARLEAALAQRDMLVKEVHHRIKNNLQGVAGLLQQIATRKPEVASAISEVVGQVQAIAQVYGLQVGLSGPLRLPAVVEAITGSVQRTFGRNIVLAVSGDAPERWVLPEAESIPIALTLNELLTNAVKHSIDRDPQAQRSDVYCDLRCEANEVVIEVRNSGKLPEGFTLARFPGGVSGLGLVRALLPRRSARLTLEQHGDDVIASAFLKPPGVLRADAP
ncbi:PAS domain S-box protein [soil metagenome]